MCICRCTCRSLKRLLFLDTQPLPCFLANSSSLQIKIIWLYLRLNSCVSPRSLNKLVLIFQSIFQYYRCPPVLSLSTLPRLQPRALAVHQARAAWIRGPVTSVRDFSIQIDCHVTQHDVLYFHENVYAKNTSARLYESDYSARSLSTFLFDFSSQVPPPKTH